MAVSRKGRTVVLSDADADALASEIDALEPPAYTPEQALEKFAERIRGRLEAGVAPEAVAKVFAARGFKVPRSAILALGKGQRARNAAVSAGAGGGAEAGVSGGVGEGAPGGAA